MLVFISETAANEIASNYNQKLTDNVQLTDKVLLCKLPNTPHFLVGDDLTEFQDHENENEKSDKYLYDLALSGYDVFLEEPTSALEMHSWKIFRIKETFKFVVGYTAPRTWKKEQLILRIVEKEAESIANKKAKFFPNLVQEKIVLQPTEQQIQEFWSKGNFRMLLGNNRQVGASETNF